MASQYVSGPAPKGTVRPSDVYDDDAWQLVPVNRPGECLASATADLLEGGSESSTIVRDCGSDECETCIKARIARLEEMKEAESLTAEQFDITLDELSRESDPLTLTFTTELEDQGLTPLDCDTNIGELIDEWISEHPEPEPGCDVSCDHQAAPCPHSPFAKELNKIDEILAGVATQNEPEVSDFSDHIMHTNF